ncbi:Ras GTPase-activating-like protein IQGAP2 [Heterocephalus glaber]|uniref:Ras GTPase-activating-like protein IQGAP2 n=1 Tax=Heterocephalus glaber TaxID=10181 RepID=G5ATK8_HETGA|nr:Ras GTPase-activating-like protein IQGAP2 [Heterocephalus glaber]
MDERRRQNIAYEYLCHLEEAKRWMEVCLVEELPPTTELEEGLRNGVYLAKLAKFFAPKMVSEKKIYDVEQTRYKKSGLHFRHTDNTVQWLRAMESIGLPKIFYPETTDVYDRKNIPRMIYCIHALSLYLFKLGIAPQIQDLLGKVDFTEEEISNMRKELEKYGIQMPSFSKIGGILANELSVDEAALHAAVIAINEAIEKGIPEQTIVTLRNPNAVLTLVDDSLAQEYQKELWGAKRKKEENSKLKNNCISEEERDAYEELLTQAEIQGNINKVNRLVAVDHINAVIQKGDPENTLVALKKPEAQLPAVYPFAAVMYQNELSNLQRQNAMNYLAHEELLIAVEMLSAVALLNQALESNDLVSVENQLRSPTIGFNNLDEAYVERESVQKLMELAYQTLREATTSIAQCAVQLFYSVRNIFHLFHDVVPTYHKENLQKLPQLAAIHHNNCMYIAHPLLTLGHQFRLCLASILCDGTTTFVDLLPGFRRLGTECFLAQMWVQKGELLERLSSARNFSNMDDEENYSAASKAVRQNYLAHEELLIAVEMLSAVALLNQALESNDLVSVENQLRSPTIGFNNLDEAYVERYTSALLSFKLEAISQGQDNLSWNEIQNCIDMINAQIQEENDRIIAIGYINEAIDEGNPFKTLDTLLLPTAKIKDVNPAHSQHYQDVLHYAKSQKLMDPESVSKVLWLEEIQQAINEANLDEDRAKQWATLVIEVNRCLEEQKSDDILSVLKSYASNAQNIISECADGYYKALVKAKESKPESVMWLLQRGLWHLDGVSRLPNLSQILSLPRVLRLRPLTVEKQLSMFTVDHLRPMSTEGSWLKLSLQEKYDYYYNIDSKESSWVTPESWVPKESWLKREEIEDIIEEVTVGYIREKMWNASEDLLLRFQATSSGPMLREQFEARKSFLHDQEENVVKIQDIIEEVTVGYIREKMWNASEDLLLRFQATSSGPMLREQFEARKSFLHDQEENVVKIQAFWKGYKQQKAYLLRRQTFAGNVDSIVKIQSWFRMATAKKNYLSRLQYFKDHKNEIVKIQSLLRASKARDVYRTLVGSENPPLTVIRKFVHLLDQSDLDFQEDLEVARLREEVVTKIRGNQQLEKDLNLMDIKIGLLVKNRITVEVSGLMRRKKLNKKKGGEVEILNSIDNQGIKSLSKERRKTLETYQQLFYLLQTNPLYLAKLIFQMPQNKSTKFMDTVIFTLYNYASNQREEYLLLKLFKTALEEEIKSKVDQVQDIVTGNPTVIKMVVSFNRGARGQNTLRQLLAPVVKEIIDDKSLVINTSPVEVYKAWVNQLETQTGEASKLPYDVTTEQALTYPEVRNKLEASIESLRKVTDKVLNSIISSLDLLPYGLRYIAKVLKNSIHEKFPDATEDELLKIVGNLLYYRYMNPAIVAPDGFDIIDMTAGGQINSDQRRNLGSVAKVLQHAASNKLFEGENEHLSSMNNYLSETYQEFRKCFKEACNVPEPEEKFNMDKYTDLVTVSKPVIYISIEEIINTHSLLLEHQDALAPEKSDSLNKLLELLGSAPSVESFLGEGAVDPNDPNKENTLNQLSKTEISLYLTSKYDIEDGSAIDGRSLMIKTKKLIIDVIRNQPGATLTEILETPATEQQEQDHAKDMVSRAVMDSRSPEDGKQSQAMMEDAQLPLEQKKRKIQRNLRTLEQTGHVSSKNKYQDILNEIAKDIRNQRIHRKLRKAELAKLQQTLKALNEKAAFYEEQINYYDTYIKTCLDNLKRKNTRRSIKLDGKGEPKGMKRAKPVRYTAAKLHEKGVLLGIDDLQTNQFKNVTFDIIATEDVGIFDVRSKFLGVEMETVQLNIQDLLQMQYEGVAVMKMFDKVKVNVNLLIYLLNKKFYGK